ncbi:Holliday junction branch migration protein RuvA [Candidatus Dojkabacteria bacterium]|nr:Holliday junction branch migration protein RuvA [Candidatus Dojkabacteria bacterium]
MLGFLQGEVTEKIGEESIIEVSDGIGYLVRLVGVNVLEGRKISVYIYTYVREDAIRLYGFETKKDLQLFKMLLSVSGIGPKSATALVESRGSEQIANAILTENTAGLKVTGVGNKTAKKIILELKKKIEELGIDTEGAETRSVEQERIKKKFSEVKDALLGLGYTSREIQRVISEIKDSENTNNQDVGELLKSALIYLKK